MHWLKQDVEIDKTLSGKPNVKKQGIYLERGIVEGYTLYSDSIPLRNSFKYYRSFKLF